MVCESLEWELGALWKVDTEAHVLRCVDVWHVPTSKVKQFEELTKRSTFTKGVGLPGRIWDNSEPAWISDIEEDPNCPRPSAAALEDLHGALGLPILIGSVVV